MIILLSPAKSMDYKKVPSWVSPTQNEFLDEAEVIASKLESLSKNKLQTTLGVSAKIAQLNYDRFKQWNHSDESAELLQPAAWSYSGDVYNGLNIESFSKQDIAYAQSKIKIVSGLYGIVRPCDLILPYRLEMGTKLSVKGSHNLYDFWGDRLASAVLAAKDEVVLNCASQEYSKAVLPCLEGERVISPVFMQESDTGPKQKALFSKYMRGVMARWVVQNRVEDASKITSFSEEGFVYSKDLTTSPDEPVFVVSKDFSLAGRFTG